MMVMKLLRSLRSSPVFFCTCLLALASPAQAALITYSAVVYNEGFFDGNVTIQNPPVIGGGTSAVGYNSAVVPGLATSGSGTAEYGALRATAFSGVANPGVGATSVARGQGGAIWIDQLTFSSATLTGSAFARAIFSLSGGLDSIADAGATANSTIGARIEVDGNLVYSASGQLLNQGGSIAINDQRIGLSDNGVFDSDPVGALTGSFAFDIPFTFNVPFTMTASLNAETQALSGRGGATANASSNFGASGIWGGNHRVASGGWHGTERLQPQLYLGLQLDECLCQRSGAGRSGNGTRAGDALALRGRPARLDRLGAAQEKRGLRNDLIR